MKTILVVEDEKMIRQGLVVMIKRSGVPVREVLEAANGVAALELLQTNQVDVIFTDIRMPKMDGIQLVKEVQTLPDPPIVVAVSGYDEFSYAVEMLRSGVREYILKPVERDKVKAILQMLEEELAEKAEKEQGSRFIGFQQLKYLMLNDNITVEETENLMKQYSASFFQGDYVVCCTNNTAGSLTSGEHYIYLSDVESHELYILEESSKDALVEQKLGERFVGISGIHQGLEELKQAYLEAVEARRKAFWHEKRIIIWVPETGERDEEVKASEMGLLVQQLGTDKEEASRRQIADLFHNGKRGNHSPAYMETSIELLIDQLLETYGNVVGVGQEEANGFYRIYEYECADRLERGLNEWIGRLSEKLHTEFDDYKNKQKIQQAILYIKENYHTDVNMAVVSNTISMNYSLFSYAFKQYTGSKFVDYIKDLRIQEAKRLLETTEMRVNEISQKVGYDNEKHFMKTFKSVCGVSPTEYRKNMLYKGN